MKLDALFFADSAEMAADRLRVTGGIWDGLTATSFPAVHHIPVVVLLRPEPADVGQSFHLDLPVTGPDGAPAGHQHVDVLLNVHRQQTAVVVSVPATFPVAGRYTVTLQSPIGTASLDLDVVGRDGGVAAAVEGYALGLGRG